MKKIGITISFVSVLFFAFGFGVAKYSGSSEKTDVDAKIYTMQEALSDDLLSANFNVEEKGLTLSHFIVEGGSLDLAVSKEDEQKLFEDIEQWQLVKWNDEGVNINHQYSLYLSINTGYRVSIDSADKTVTISNGDNVTTYKILTGDTFFNMLEKIKREEAGTKQNYHNSPRRIVIVF